MNEINTKPETEEALQMVTKGLQVIDKLRLEKFNLKRQLVWDKMKFNQLKKSMLEVKNEMKDRELDMKRSSMGELIEEKRAL